MTNDLLRCCDRHGRTCRPDALCCYDCAEAAHPGHADGSACPSPDMGALDTIGPIFKEGWDQPHARDDRWW